MCFLPLPRESQGANSSLGVATVGKGKQRGWGLGGEQLYLLNSMHDPRNVLKSFLP